MANDPKADLIYAILALDSYNRGYGSGITLLDENGKVGNWTIDKNSIKRATTGALRRA